MFSCFNWNIRNSFLLLPFSSLPHSVLFVLTPEFLLHFCSDSIFIAIFSPASPLSHIYWYFPLAVADSSMCVLPGIWPQTDIWGPSHKRRCSPNTLDPQMSPSEATALDRSNMDAHQAPHQDTSTVSTYAVPCWYRSKTRTRTIHCMVLSGRCSVFLLSAGLHTTQKPLTGSLQTKHRLFVTGQSS